MVCRDPRHLLLLPPTPASTAAPCPATSAQDEWWSAEIPVPFWGVNITFVLSMWEHWDNNEGRDHKIKVGGVEGWGGGLGGCWGLC